MGFPPGPSKRQSGWELGCHMMPHNEAHAFRFKHVQNATVNPRGMKWIQLVYYEAPDATEILHDLAISPSPMTSRQGAQWPHRCRHPKKRSGARLGEGHGLIPSHPEVRVEEYSYDGSMGSVICLMSSIRLATKETDDEHDDGGK